MRDLVLVHDALEIPARAENRDAGLLFRKRFLVQEADGLQAETGPLEQARGQELPDPAGTDDERRLQHLTATVGPPLGPAEDNTPRDQACGPAEPRPYRLRRREARVRGEDTRRRNGHRRNDRRADHPAQLLEEMGLQAADVAAAGIEQ